MTKKLVNNEEYSDSDISDSESDHAPFGIYDDDEDDSEDIE